VPRGVRFGEGMSSSSMGVGSFLTFWLKIVHFGVYSDKNSQFIRPIAGLKNCILLIDNSSIFIANERLLQCVYCRRYDRLTTVPGIRI